MKIYIVICNIDCLKVVFIMSEYTGCVGIIHRKCTASVFFLNAYLGFCLA